MSTSPIGTEELDFTLDRDADVPLGVQLSWAMRARIGDGRFAPGTRLPGLRELADSLGVNVNTVRAVYRRLEQDGLIESRQGSGTFVTARNAGWTAAIAIAADAAIQASRTGADPREVAAALYISPNPGEQNVQAQRRSRLRSQVAALEQAAAELEAQHPGLLGAHRRGARRAPGDASGRLAPSEGAHLPSTAELEQVRLTLLRRLTSLQAAIDALGHAENADRPHHPSQTEPTSGQDTNGEARSRDQASDGRRAKRRPTRPAAAGA